VRATSRRLCLLHFTVSTQVQQSQTADRTIADHELKQLWPAGLLSLYFSRGTEGKVPRVPVMIVSVLHDHYAMMFRLTVESLSLLSCTQLCLCTYLYSVFLFLVMMIWSFHCDTDFCCTNICFS
jgi:hypothetical protein